MKDEDVVKAFSALAQPMRLKVFRALVVAGPAGMTPGALVEQLEVAAPTLSFHLKELLHAGLATQEREGRSLTYRASYDRMNALIGFMVANCCAGQPVAAGETSDCAC